VISWIISSEKRLWQPNSAWITSDDPKQEKKRGSPEKEEPREHLRSFYS
jgi:hypothetical protein